jgi:protein-L-isoaspartate O-methyltransferase
MWFNTKPWRGATVNSHPHVEANWHQAITLNPRRQIPAVGSGFGVRTGAN